MRENISPHTHTHAYSRLFFPPKLGRRV
ncbi:hypothetical protein TSAR_009910 [Trichomalopsis sarcophagae]|uniref:Uncharacterized protein n=1 Tax=Trichomalopsis sarcophagae TaxID=543379 RepID=A0A232FMU4_9HYME|nr:hypothetical protein TSAR_009910 [Trichomalopsis sarcophagae]